MNVLVIGGTVFLGRAVVAQAQAAGADVTVFNRGVSGTPPPGVTQVRGDRTVAADLEQLRGRGFDLVIDTCGYVPADVGPAADLLARSCGHYAFVSSISAYPGWPEQADYQHGGPWDGNPDATAADVPDAFDGSQAYGWLKVGCEEAVRRAFGADRCTLLRAGCIVGPDDAAVGRLPWWLDRVARGGELLAPGDPHDPVALIDARDLAAFALRASPGTFECGGPVGRDDRAGLLAACVRATGAQVTPLWVDDEWLAAQDVQGWTELPLWLPAAQAPGLWRHDNAAARAAGLTWRPLTATAADTWRWMQRLPAPWRASERAPGLGPGRERALLALWRTRNLL